jgi:hypothetical protein
MGLFSAKLALASAGSYRKGLARLQMLSGVCYLDFENNAALPVTCLQYRAANLAVKSYPVRGNDSGRYRDQD